MSDSFFTTTRGHEQLIARLKHVKEVERMDNVRDIEEARAHGDLKENAEYHAAKEKQAWIVHEIGLLEDKLARARVIDPSKLSGDKVTFGCHVTVLNIDSDDETVFQIVGEDEADIKSGLLNYKSPLAKALIGKEEGDEVLFQAPGGERNYEIVEVAFK